MYGYSFYNISDSRSFNCLYAKISFDCAMVHSDGEEESITLRRILIGKILLLKATVLSKLNKEEDCEAAFKKALTYNAGKFKYKSETYN